MAAGKMFKGRRGKVSKPVKKYVNNVINKRSETKRAVSSALRANAEPVSGTILEIDLTAIAQGVGDNQRVGNACNLTKIEFDLTFEKRLATDVSNIIRCILYSPKDPTTRMTTVQVQGYPDLDQFNILYDRSFSMFDAENPSKRLVYSKRFPKGRHLRYTASGAGTCIKGNLLLYIVADSSTTVAPKCTYRARAFFKDM